jgi:adenine-specific DNA-methyltransferase
MTAEQRSAPNTAGGQLQAVPTIFIAGSRQIETIPAEAVQRISNIIGRRYKVIIGDAPAADMAVQRYMTVSAYPHVTVFCSGRRCRNNLNGWPTRHILPPADAQGFQFYAAKDREMVHSADFALMLWDGRSIGTLANAMRLAYAAKPTVLFNALQETTFNIRTADQWPCFAASLSPALRAALKFRF